MKRILMVCEGNICRSPIAEGLFRRNLSADREIRSAGIHALVGHPAAPFAVETCQRHGIDIQNHRARQLDPMDVRWADLVLAMETPQVAAIVSSLPWSAGRVWPLGHRIGQELTDIFGMDRMAFEHFFTQAEHAFESWSAVLGVE